MEATSVNVLWANENGKVIVGLYEIDKSYNKGLDKLEEQNNEETEKS
jgi:gamma-glutamylcyclotransferase (GGCT)/AIG2-like uncharacterized protein YtfP